MHVNRCHAHVLVPAEIDSMLLPGASVPPACTATVPAMEPEPPSVPPDTVTAELARELFTESRPPVTLVAPVYVWAEESMRLPVPPLVNEPEPVMSPANDPPPAIVSPPAAPPVSTVPPVAFKAAKVCDRPARLSVPPVASCSDEAAANEPFAPSAAGRHSDLHCIVLSGAADEFACPAELAGHLAALINKTAPLDELRQEVEAVVRSRQGVGPEAVRENPTMVLRPRELEVFTLIGKGMTSRQIAESLGISLHTVSTHRQAIASKLGVAGAELVRLATVYTQTR